MSGYVPLFDSIATGTLYGRWPDIGVWPIVLAIADKHGHLDVTPHYLAGVLGLPVEQVAECMKRFCEPDPYSRTKEHGGARLRLLDDHRDWGWSIVNHGKYREKARLMSKDSARTESGKDAQRKRDERIPRCPPDSPAIPLSDSDANTDSNSDSGKENTARLEFLDFKVAYPARAGDQGWINAQKFWNRNIERGHTPEQMVGAANLYALYVAATGGEGTQFVKKASTFLDPNDDLFLGDWTPPANKAERRLDANIDSMNQFLKEG